MSSNSAHPNDVIGMDKQAVADGQYMAAYFAGDPKLNSTYPYPVTCGDLNTVIRTGNRVDPNINTVRRKGAKIGSQSSQLLVNQDVRTLNPANHPFATRMMYCAQTLPDVYLDTRRINTGRPIVAPYSLA
jgi:hypothetical protein